MFLTLQNTVLKTTKLPCLNPIERRKTLRCFLNKPFKNA